jgi:osmotically-inducible protein OsmY
MNTPSNPNRNRILARISAGLSLLGLGAITMYFLDPKSGHRRRAVARERARHYSRQAANQARAFSRNGAQRARGLAHQASELLSAVGLFQGLLRRPAPSDAKLQARALSKMGRIPHREPRTFDIQAHDGILTVTGTITDDEYERLSKTLKKIPGVKKIDRQLSVGDGQAVS